MKAEDVQIDKDQLEQQKRRNFEDRLDYIRWKVEWMREHVIQD